MNPHSLIPSGITWEDKYDEDQVQTHTHTTHDKLTKLHYLAFMTIARGQKMPDLVSVKKKLLQDCWVVSVLFVCLFCNTFQQVEKSVQVLHLASSRHRFCFI